MVIILMIILTTISATQKTSIQQDTHTILEYENVDSDLIFNYDSLPNKEFDYFNSADTTLSNNNYKTKKIEGEFLDLLIKYTPINKREEKDDLLPELVKESDFYYVGKINISSSFKSLLFMITAKHMDDYFIFRELYLININNNCVSAVIKIADYSCVDGIINFSHTFLEDSHFVYQKKELSSDVIYLYHISSEIEIVKFSFDQYGHILINK